MSLLGEIAFVAVMSVEVVRGQVKEVRRKQSAVYLEPGQDWKRCKHETPKYPKTLNRVPLDQLTVEMVSNLAKVDAGTIRMSMWIICCTSC